ncbi:MAG: hypothetical protein PUE54_02315 [Bacteroidales bacterium]|nr:hypothetical protein [Bacteroidales bacterium]
MAKIVQGERKTKRKRSFQVFVFPSRSLSYLKIVQIECKSKSKLVLKFDFAEMQPILREAKVVQGERKTKRKRSFQDLFFQAAAGL